MAKKRKHLLVLTDARLVAALTALRMEFEDWAASGENHTRASASHKVLARQRCEGLDAAEQTWAMEEIVRLGRSK